MPQMLRPILYVFELRRHFDPIGNCLAVSYRGHRIPEKSLGKVTQIPVEQKDQPEAKSCNQLPSQEGDSAGEVPFGLGCGTLRFHGVDLRLSGLVEMLISQHDNTALQLGQMGRWYKEQALRELYPTRNSLSSTDVCMRRRVAKRAIEMALADCRSGIERP